MYADDYNDYFPVHPDWSSTGGKDGTYDTFVAASPAHRGAAQPSGTLPLAMLALQREIRSLRRVVKATERVVKGVELNTITIVQYNNPLQAMHLVLDHIDRHKTRSSIEAIPN